MNNTNTTNPNSVSVQAVPFNSQTQSFGVAPTPVTPIQPPTIPNSQNITTFGTQQLNLPPVNITQPNVTDINQAQELIQKTAVEETEAQKADKSLSKFLYEIAPKLQGQAAEQALQEKRFGRDEKLLQLNALNNEIRMKDAELRQDDIKLAQSIQNIEDKPIAMEFITGQQQSVARNAQIMRALKVSERDMMNARAVGLQGDITLAESMAKKAVEEKYAPWKELLETVKMQQEFLKPILDADEKKQLREQEIKTTLAMNDIKKREKNETDIQQMIVTASSQGAPQNIVDKAKTAKDPATAAMILGQYAGDYYKTQLLKAEIAKTYAQTKALTQPVSLTGQIETLPKAQQERYYKLQGDFDKATEKYRGAIDSAKNLNALSQNSTAQDQTAIIFSYMKTLDPSSTVREGEFALVGSTAGLGDRATNALAQLDSGKRLNETQIRDIVGAATKLANVAKQNLDGTSKEYDRRATKFGLPGGLFYEPQGEVVADVKSYVDVVDRAVSGQSQNTPSSYLESLGLKKTSN